MLLMLKVATFTGSLSVPAAAGFAATTSSHYPAGLYTKAALSQGTLHQGCGAGGSRRCQADVRVPHTRKLR